MAEKAAFLPRCEMPENLKLLGDDVATTETSNAITLCEKRHRDWHKRHRRGNRGQNTHV